MQNNQSDWQCPNCGITNHQNIHNCRNCQQEKPGNEVPDNNDSLSKNEQYKDSDQVKNKAVTYEDAARKAEAMINAPQKKHEQPHNDAGIQNRARNMNMDKNKTNYDYEKNINFKQENNREENVEEVNVETLKTKQESITNEKINSNLENMTYNKSNENHPSQYISDQDNNHSNKQGFAPPLQQQMNPGSDNLVGSTQGFNSTNPQPKPRGKGGKFLVVFVIILTLLAGAAGGGWYYYSILKVKQEKTEVLNKQVHTFNQVISAINELDSENLDAADTGSEDDFEMLKRQGEEEKHKTEKALAEVDKTLESLNNQPEDPTNIKLKEFYTDSKSMLEEYDTVVAYSLEISDVVMKIDKRMEDMQSTFKNPNDNEQVLNMFSTIQESLDEIIKDINKIDPPEGLSEFHEKINNILRDTAIMIDKMKEIVEDGNIEQMQVFLTTDPTIQRISNDQKEGLELYYIYADGLHNRFDDARKKADEIKIDMVKEKTELDAEIEIAEIEAW